MDEENNVYLTLDRDKICEKLEKCILEGRMLYNKPIREDQNPKFSKVNIDGKILDKYIEPDYIHDYLAKKHNWINLVTELLSRAFSKADNQYKREFYKCGVDLYTNGSSGIIRDIKTEIKSKFQYLEGLKERLDFIPVNNRYVVENRIKTNSKRVFVVHGHDEELRLKVENFIFRLGLEPIVLFKEPSEGKTIIEKIEKEANDACFAIVLYTACDLGNDKQEVKTISDLNKRARQNVVFEHGYLLCKLGRSHVCALVEDGVETPGDMDGVVYIRLSDNWKKQVLKELIAAGVRVDVDKI